MNTHLRNVRAAWSATAESTPLTSLYRPAWSEPAVSLARETYVDGRLVHNLPWAAARSFTVASRVASIPLGAAIAVVGWAATAILGTTLGGVGATFASVRDAMRHEHRADLAAHRGFVKGYTVAAFAVAGAAWLLAIPARVAGAAVGAVGAVALTGPYQLAGTLMDHRAAPATGASAVEVPTGPAVVLSASATDVQLALPGC